jgi:uncharacterized RDD family membrane protein YckC
MPVRAAALLVDALFALIVLGAAVGLATGEAYHSGGSSGFRLTGWSSAVWVAVSLGYWTVCERLWGMTIGKRLFSIRVVGRDGTRPGWRASAIRNVLRLVDAFPYAIPYLLGALVASSDGERRRIGDRAAGTRVTAPG